MLDNMDYRKQREIEAKVFLVIVGLILSAMLVLMSGCASLTTKQLGDISDSAGRARGRANIMSAVAKRYPPKAGEEADFKTCLNKAASGIEAQAVQLESLCKILNIVPAPAKE